MTKELAFSKLREFFCLWVYMVLSLKSSTLNDLFMLISVFILGNVLEYKRYEINSLDVFFESTVEPK